MKIKSIFALLFAALTITSCSKDSSSEGTITTPSEKTNVFLQLSGGVSRGRAVEPSSDGTKAELLSAIIYFTDNAADPMVFAVRTIGNSGADATITELQTGVQFTEIPSSVKQVYVVGNYNSSDQEGKSQTFPTSTGIKLSKVKELAMDIQQVTYPELADGSEGSGLLTILDGTANVYKFGTDPDQWDGSVNIGNGDLYASVKLTPLIARMELHKMQYSGTLESFNVEGIYINNYYSSTLLKLPANSSGSLLTDNGSETDKYTSGHPNFAYAKNTTMFDMLNKQTTVVSGNAEIKPEEGVWAYHVFGEHSPAIPHIVIRFTNLVTENGTMEGDRFLTVKGFLHNGQELNKLSKGKLYRITNLAFDDDDLQILPETSTVPIWVSVEVEDWETVDVSPIM